MSNSRISVCSLIVCLILGIEVRAQPSNYPIGNPNDVSMKDFPWHASAISVSTDSILCGAVIISDRHVLTSASCLRHNNLDDMHVTVGSSTYDEGSRYRIKSNHSHPNYNPILAFAHDIAVIEIDGVITFNETQSPIALPDKDIPLPVGTTLTLTGWGFEMAGSFSNQLRKQNLNIVEKRLCDEFMEGITGDPDFPHMEASQLCSFPAEDTPDCLGNMGSGVVLGKNLVGIFQQAGPCGQGFLEFVTKVWEHVAWIREVTNLKPNDSLIGSPHVILI